VRKNPKLIHVIDWEDHRGAKEYDTIQKKIIQKHGVYPREVKDTFVHGENPVLYKSLGEADDPELDGERGLYLGKIENGRYIKMFAIAKSDGEGILLSANEMRQNEKETYWQYYSKEVLI